MAIPGLQLGAPNPGTAMMRVPGLAKALVGSGMTGWQKRAKHARKNSREDIMKSLEQARSNPMRDSYFGSNIKANESLYEGALKVKDGAYYHDNNRVNEDGTMTPLSPGETKQLNANFRPAMSQQGTGQSLFSPKGSASYFPNAVMQKPALQPPQQQPNQQLIAALMPRNKIGF